MALKGYEHKGPAYAHRHRKFPKDEWKKMQVAFADLLLVGETKNVEAFKMLILRSVKGNEHMFTYAQDKFEVWATNKCRQYGLGSRKPAGYDAGIKRVFEMVRAKLEQRMGDRRHNDSWTRYYQRKRTLSIPLTLGRVELLERRVRLEARRAKVTQPFCIMFGDGVGEHWSSGTGAVQTLSVPPIVVDRHWFGGMKYYNGEFVIGSNLSYSRSHGVVFTLAANNIGGILVRDYEVSWTQILSSRERPET